MKTTAWRWLVLLLIPGCILVQPLDEAKPDDDDSVPATSGGPSKAGSGNGSSGGPSKAGSGNAGRGGSSAAGAPNGGGGTTGVDFSLFTGNWTLIGGTNTTTCEGEDPVVTDADTGTPLEVVLGTTSDVIFGPRSACPILGDVDDRSAFLNSGTLPCSENDGTYNFYSTTDYFEFAVSDDEQTAGAGISSTVIVTDLDDNPVSTCQVEQSLDYKR